MGAIGLNPIRLDRIGLDPIRINAIKLGVPGASSGSDRPYIDPEVLASLKAVCICYGKSNDDPDRSIVKNLVDPDNPFVISNAAYTEGSGYADKGSPYYGAFVTDGIDDLITSTKTVQEMLGGSNEITVVSMIHQIADRGSTFPNIYNNQIRYSTRLLRSTVTAANVVGKTGIYGYTATGVSITGTPTGKVVNDILGDKNDYPYLASAFTGIDAESHFSVEGYLSDTGIIVETSQVAWYWTIIANKVLTTDQINQVIAYFNLDRTLKPDILCNTIKQGITNENHAEFGDKLIDFSGNGRDIQLNNIAWKGDSGIGKYEEDFLQDWWTHSGVLERNSLRVKYKGNIGFVCYKDVHRSPERSTIPSFKVSIEGAKVQYGYINSDGVLTRILLDEGIQTVPQSFVGTNGYVGFLGATDFTNPDEIITITQIPSHAGGLCLDGVNDFGKVTGMPIYKDYTVVTDREIFTNTGAISSKNNPGAFVETAGNSVYSFGQATSDLNFISTRSISYLSKYSYCGQSITAGAAEDGTDMWLGTIRDNDSRFFNGAIYSLMTFPYSMSEFLIERQLKKHKLGTLYPNMVEFRPIVKSNLPYSSISYSVNPGEYISVDSMVTITVTLPNTSDKLMELSCNAISDISISGDNGVYEITGKIVKSPQKINMIISSYLTMLSNSTLISNETLIKNE